jgi:hypothetical protein
MIDNKQIHFFQIFFFFFHVDALLFFSLSLKKKKEKTNILVFFYFFSQFQNIAISLIVRSLQRDTGKKFFNDKK